MQRRRYRARQAKAYRRSGRHELSYGINGREKATRYTILGAVFIEKEIYDHNKHNAAHGHLGDIAADIGGVAISEGCIWLIHKTW